MKLLRKLPNSVREAPGLEWVVLKKLPLTLLLGTLFPLVISLANRGFPPEGTPAQIAKHRYHIHRNRSDGLDGRLDGRYRLFRRGRDEGTRIRR